MGAPTGSVSCSYTPLPSSSVFPTQLEITVNGDRCTACGMKEDYCPKYYDVHNCDMTWSWEDTQPSDSPYTFTIKYTVNGAPRTWGISLLAVSLSIAIIIMNTLRG